MNTFEQLETVWKVPRKLVLPDVGTILRQASKDKNVVAKRILLQVVLLMLSIASLAFVLFRIHFQYPTSFIGIALMIACVAGFSFSRFRQVIFLLKADISVAPNTFLRSFTAFHEKQKWLNTTGVLIYISILNLAFAFYFYEMVVLAPITTGWKFSIIAGYLAWMLFATFYLGKRSVKKEHQKTMAVIQKLRQLNQMLESN